MCLSCHLGNAREGRVVTHEMYAAGHPPLPGFEHMGHIGCVFEGTDATLVTSYDRHEVYVDGTKVGDGRVDATVCKQFGHSDARHFTAHRIEG